MNVAARFGPDALDGATVGAGVRPGVSSIEGRDEMTIPPRPAANTIAAAAPKRAKRFMVWNLHGSREARRCGIDGKAASTVARTSRRRKIGIGLEPVRDAGLEVGINGFGSCRSLLGRRERTRPSWSSTARS